uniref:Uncharacterized protein n=1 Tax=Lotharella globosa TaxID=91324 RepID=A0A7S3Z7Z4_9EUKA|mmetsp:Transcript_16197/g.32822  ORF Transcript_16197/g.32822 Transcript_16197/m.32822 type:complete len:228 (-) Transcript_16197:126-809(-)
MSHSILGFEFKSRDHNVRDFRGTRFTVGDHVRVNSLDLENIPDGYLSMERSMKAAHNTVAVISGFEGEDIAVLHNRRKLIRGAVFAETSLKKHELETMVVNIFEELARVPTSVAGVMAQYMQLEAILIKKLYKPKLIPAYMQIPLWAIEKCTENKKLKAVGDYYLRRCPELVEPYNKCYWKHVGLFKGKRAELLLLRREECKSFPKSVRDLSHALTGGALKILVELY